MHLRRLAWLAVAAVAACSGTDTTRPPDSTPTSFAISDGTHSGGNNHFFFLPPMVPDPSSSFTSSGFNPTLIPTVQVCFLPGTEGTINAATLPDCTHYSAAFGAPVNATLQQYQGNWNVPRNPDVFYRVSVWISGVGTGIRLGFADVQTVANPSQLRSVNGTKFVGIQDGGTLPVKFRIEVGALCFGISPCSEAIVNLASGGTVDITTSGTHQSGVTIPPQAGGPQKTITVQTCPNLNPTYTDLPTFGSCIRVKPADVVTLTTPASVHVCDLTGTIDAAGLVDEAQEGRVTLHRLDGTTLHALPHVAGCAEFTGQDTPSFGSVLAELGHGHLRAAGGKLLAMLGPTPLYARRRLNLGGGGATSEFSDFQFALPAKMTITAGNNQFAFPGTQVASPLTVTVTDLADIPVKNATVHFATTDGSVSPLSIPTGVDGKATTAWTLGSTIGLQHMTASGRGIAGGNADGPRCNFDPFQPIQLSPSPPEFGQGPCLPDGPVDTPVLLQTGTRVFSATGLALIGSSYTSTPGSLTDCASPCPASLYSVDRSTGTATLIGPIGFNRVGAMDFHPTSGVLYATGERPSDNVPVLITINASTGAGTEVGPTGISGNISDVSFRSDGTLFVYDATSADHKLYTVNVSTGVATLVGSTGLSSNSGNGIAFDATDVLHHSNRDFSNILSQTTGTATQVTSMSFPIACTSSGPRHRIAASDLESSSNVFFAVVKCGGGAGPDVAFLGTVNYSTGVVTLIGPTVAGLDGLARKN